MLWQRALGNGDGEGEAVDQDLDARARRGVLGTEHAGDLQQAGVLFAKQMAALRELQKEKRKKPALKRLAEASSSGRRVGSLGWTYTDVREVDATISLLRAQVERRAPAEHQLVARLATSLIGNAALGYNLYSNAYAALVQTG